MEEKLREAIAGILDRKLGYDRQPGDTFSCEIYADYRDEMDSKTAIRILQSQDPSEAFWEQLSEWYEDYEWQLRFDLEQELREELTADDGPFPRRIAEEANDLLHDLLPELVEYQLPEEHYLKQTFRVNIMVDTGDGNYDYTLNSAYPCWYGSCDAPIDDRAGIVWLAKTQGYTNAKLRRALQQGDMREPKGFLQSMRVELANLASAMSTVTFLVELTLKELMELNRLIRLQDREGRHYDSRKNPYCGYIVLDKATETGLYDPWHGGGSCFEIELEKDVRLPVKYIRSALPDGGDGYSVEKVYGMCGSAWQRGGIKTIHAPVKMPA